MARLRFETSTAREGPRPFYLMGHAMEKEVAGGILTEFDVHLFREGTHSRLYQKLGAHAREEGTQFGLWAPNARSVNVVGDFNNWDPGASPLEKREDSGLWEGLFPGIRAGEAYRFHIVSWHQGFTAERRDPFAFRLEAPPGKNAFVWELHFPWSDQDWLERRRQVNLLQSPVSIYRVDSASWRRVPEDGNRPLTYQELGHELVEYVKQMGFTHVQLRPVMQPPKYSVQEITGYFAPAARQGAPQDLMQMIDLLHRNGIGVILEWVASHFPSGDDGLAYFDGAQLYEHTIWPVLYPGDGYGFDLSKGEVRSFLLSSACFWLEVYHADGLHLGNANTLLYLDSGRRPGEWLPNPQGGRERAEGIAFLRELNEQAGGQFPGIQMSVGETAGWSRVTRATAEGGLGFDLQWDEQTPRQLLEYLNHDSFFRKFHHDLPLARGDRAFAEHTVLPLPEERTVLAGASLLPRLAGERWQQFAGLRLLLGWIYLQPGKKLVWMGSEFAQWNPWNPNGSLDWHLLGDPLHQGAQRWVRDLNNLYVSEKALYESDAEPEGFEWGNTRDADQSTYSWLRRDPGRREVLLVVANCTPVVRRNHRVGVRRGGLWREVLNSDALPYGGAGHGNLGTARTSPFSTDGMPHTLTLTLPPLGILVLKWNPEAGD